MAKKTISRRSTRARKPYHHGDLSEALLRATAQVLRKSGLPGLSLREVARVAGVSHGAPAHHYRDKAGLLTAFATQGFERFRSAMEQARDAAPPSGAERLAATGIAYVMFSQDHREHFEVMWRPELLQGSDPRLGEAQLSAYAVLLGVVAEAQADGYAAGVPADVVATRSWALAHGLAALWLQGNLHEGASIEALTRAVIRSYALG